MRYLFRLLTVLSKRTHFLLYKYKTRENVCQQILRWTLSEVAAKPRVKLRITRSVGRWAPLQYKMEDERQKYAGREQLAVKHIGYRNICKSPQKYLGVYWMRYGEKAHCLSRQASFVLFLHGFSRQDIALVFLGDEAVSESDMFNSQPSFRHISHYIFQFYIAFL